MDWATFFGYTKASSEAVVSEVVSEEASEDVPKEKEHPNIVISDVQLDDFPLTELVKHDVYNVDLTCLHCNKKYKNIVKLRQHEELRCKKNPRLHKCKWCKKRFRVLKMHKKACPERPPTYQCTCGMRYKSFRSLHNHVKKYACVGCQRVESKRYQCDYDHCNRTFSSLRGKYTHMGHIHKT
tara:strand:- start:954 stop:1499 length:546 start_codon:yes stop_codon:yes gene_type:complete